MSQLNLYPLPYTASQPPQELVRHVRTVSGYSDTAAFDMRLDSRDMFLGQRRCVICGNPDALEHCHIVGRSDLEAWALLKRLGWAPAGVKESAGHESRNGLLMCPNHHHAFDHLQFFIHYQPTTKRYIFVHYDSRGLSPHLKQFHGKAIALDIKDMRAPLPLLFLVHEYMVRGRNFYLPTPDMEVTSGWQEWMVDKGVVNEKGDGSFTFYHEAPTSGRPAGQSLNVQTSPTTCTSPTTQVASTSGSRTVIMPPTADLVEELMAYQRTMPSWKAWQQEAMGWEGTAEENMKKYVENIGVESAE